MKRYKKVIAIGTGLFVLMLALQVAFIFSFFTDVTEFCITIGLVLLLLGFGLWTRDRIKNYRGS